MIHLVAILAHNHPELLPSLIKRVKKAGATHVALFDGSGSGLVSRRAVQLINLERGLKRRDIVPSMPWLIPPFWAKRVRWGNMLPFNHAALKLAKEVDADFLSFWDSDLMPLRTDCFQQIRDTIEFERAKPDVRDAYVSPRVTTYTKQGTWKGKDLPARLFLRHCAKHTNFAWGEALSDLGWNGDWVSHAFHPGTTFGKFCINEFDLLLDRFSEEELSFNRVCLTPEEVIFSTAAELMGVRVVDMASLRGVRWRPYHSYEDANKGFPKDWVAIHPVPRNEEFPLWSNSNLTDVT